MSRLKDVIFIPRVYRADERGWLLKIIDGKEENLPKYTSEVYLVSAVPGQIRGNHYHPKTAEWFTLAMGQAHMALADPMSGECQLYFLNLTNPVTVYVPAGIVHAFKNPSDAIENMLLAVYADQLYDPVDTILYKLF